MSSSTSNAKSVQFSKLDDFKMLVKLKLNITVVFSSALAYVIVSGTSFDLVAFLMLIIGGFLLTGGSNAMNQILEKDFDRLMSRTKDRPLAAGRMTTSEASLIAGVMAVCGITILGLFNPIAASLGALAFVSYSFIYTPLKRYSPLAVWVGAIPGALPVMIGAVAFEGTISTLAIILFAIQFIWQLPHFWAIGWLGYEDYMKAGYKLLPVAEQKRDSSIGMHAFGWALLLVPFSFVPFQLGQIGIYSCIGLIVLALIYAKKGFDLYRNANTESAKALMFFSFAYLPLALILFIVGTMGY